METLILDTSVLVKLFSKDETSEQTVALLAKLNNKSLFITIPDIAVYELINSLKYSKNAAPALIMDILDVIMKMNLRIVNFSQELLKISVKTMDKYEITIYDAIFIAMSDMEKIPLLTADYKHHRKEISQQIMYYKEWKI